MTTGNPKKPARQLRILIVDDDEMSCELLRLVLSCDHYLIEITNSGQAALEKMAGQEFDLVVTDLDMPGMKGDQLAAAIKARHPRVRILLASAHGDWLKADNQTFPGIDLIISKLASSESLRQAVESLAPDPG
jgi:CheY-like chemotaxis protein